MYQQHELLERLTWALRHGAQSDAPACFMVYGIGFRVLGLGFRVLGLLRIYYINFYERVTPSTVTWLGLESKGPKV